MSFGAGLFLGLIIGIIGTAMVWMSNTNYNYKNKYNSYGKRA